MSTATASSSALAYSIPTAVTDWAAETERYLAASAKVDVSDIDWAEARKYGLTEDEVFVLTYFSDIEHQTINYMKDLLATDAGKEADVIAFLSMWNYEEFFHGHVLARLLRECGRPLEKSRTAKVRQMTRFTEWLEAAAASMLSKIFRKSFPAVHAAWGATQEITTLHGYEQLALTTANPMLKLIAERIAKQERRHFAWYFNKAKDRLKVSRQAQWLVRTLLTYFWSPVGAGVKTKEEVARMMNSLFGTFAPQMARNVDAKIGSLPGMEGIELMVPYVRSVEPRA